MLYYIGPGNKNFRHAKIYDVVRYMDKVSMFCFDTETTGLDPHRDEVIMVQVGDENTQFVIDARHIDITPILPFLESRDKIKIGANLAFDYGMMLGNYGIRMQNLGDIMIREKVLECGRKQRGFSLKDMAKSYLKVNMPKDVRMEFAHMKNKHFSDRQIVYGANDVKYPIQIYHKQQRRISNDQLGITIHLEQQYVRVIAEMQFNGLPFRSDIWMDVFEQNKEALIEREEALNQYVRDNNIHKYLGAVDMFTGKPNVNIVWSSPKQVGEFMLHLGLPVEALDYEAMEKFEAKHNFKKDIYKLSVGKEALARLADRYPIADLFLKYKKASSAVTKYGDKWISKYVDLENMRVYSYYNQILNTGRISSTKPNLQQIPSFKSKDRYSWEAHRTAFVAPEGWTFVVRDYSSQESRLLADMANEESMIDEYLHGTGDLHSLTGTKVFSLIEGKPITVSTSENSHYRQIAKTVNFGISYGGSGGTLARKLNISREMGDEIVNSFFKAYPQLDEYFQKRHEEILKTGMLVIDPFTRRRVYFPIHSTYTKLLEQYNTYQELRYRNRILELKEPEYPAKLIKELRNVKGQLCRAAQNYPIQAGSANMTKIAMSMLYDWVKKEKLFDSVKISLALHDEIVAECKEEVADVVNKKLEEYMEYAGTFFCNKIPMKSDGGSTKVWDH